MVFGEQIRMQHHIFCWILYKMTTGSNYMSRISENIKDIFLDSELLEFAHSMYSQCDRSFDFNNV